MLLEQERKGSVLVWGQPMPKNTARQTVLLAIAAMQFVTMLCALFVAYQVNSVVARSSSSDRGYVVVSGDVTGRVEVENGSDGKSLKVDIGGPIRIIDPVAVHIETPSYQRPPNHTGVNSRGDDADLRGPLSKPWITSPPAPGR